MNHLTLWSKWRKFGAVVLSPGSVIFIVLTVIMLTTAFMFRGNTLFTTLLTVLASVLAGLAGNFIKDDYGQTNGQNILEKKGRSALRNLESIYQQLQNIHNWINEFAERKNSNQQNSVLKEINRHLSTVQMNVKSSFGDWEDIVPELKENSEREKEMSRKFNEVIQSVTTELLKKRKELAYAKDKKVEEELREKINNLEKQVRQIKIDGNKRLAGTPLSYGMPIHSATISDIDSVYRPFYKDEFDQKLSQRLFIKNNLPKRKIGDEDNPLKSTTSNTEGHA